MTKQQCSSLPMRDSSSLNVVCCAVKMWVMAWVQDLCLLLVSLTVSCLVLISQPVTVLISSKSPSPSNFLMDSRSSLLIGSRFELGRPTVWIARGTEF